MEHARISIAYKNTENKTIITTTLTFAWGRNCVLSPFSSSGQSPCKAGEGHVGSTYKLFFAFFTMMMMTMMRDIMRVSFPATLLPPLPSLLLRLLRPLLPCLAPPKTRSRPVSLHSAPCPPYPSTPRPVPPRSLPL